MDNWEDEQLQPLPAKVELKSNWDDEDVDENEIKDSWEDDDDEPTLPPVVEPLTKKSLEKAPKKANSKTVESKYKSPEAISELFGVKGQEKKLDMLLPKSEKDFLEYAKFISQGLKPFEKSYHYNKLLKTVMRLSMTNMKASDVKDVASSITAIANEKLKAEKQAVAGKKKIGGKKKQLIVDKPDDDLVAGPYDAMDDYDYM